MYPTVVVNIIFIPSLSQETRIQRRSDNLFTFCITRLSRTGAGFETTSLPTTET